MNGSRRVRAASVLPRYSPPCLFQGHLSTKSNAFCTDSSSLRLSTLHLIKNHMAVHYNKILSAKAVVDCSVPLSMSTSIKYADQQRREKLRKELARGEREMKINKQANAKNNSKSLFTILHKPSEESHVEGNVFIEEMNEFSSLTKSPVTSSEKLYLTPPKAGKVFTSGLEKNSSSSPPFMDYGNSGPRKVGSGTPSGRESRSTFPSSHRFQLVISKAPNGDLLDKHSELFSNGHLPFTPRTLKTEAKSFLSQYRYYTPAKRKKSFTDQHSEVETQTECNSFKSDCNTVEIKKFPDSEVSIKQYRNNCVEYGEERTTPLPFRGHGLLQDETSDSALRHSSSSREEELLYLSFIEDITSDILKLGLFSNRFLEQLFERHIKQNKHHLEEGKMRHLVHILKVDLGCGVSESSAKLDDAAVLSLRDLEGTGKPSENKLKSEHDSVIHLERQEYQEALHMLLSAPKEEELSAFPGDFFMPIPKTKSSEGVTVQQVSETTLPPSFWDEKTPSASESLTDSDTYVNVIEGDSDTEKVETSTELCCVGTTLSQPDQLCSISSDSQDVERSALKITEMCIED